VARSSYQLYVIDDRGRSVVVLDTHNSQGNRSWLLPDGAFTIVLESDTVKTYMVLDERGDMIIEQEDVVAPKPPPKQKQRRRSRYWNKNKSKPSEYVPGRR
jgi:hypothetical protein